jgi:hypothetical protein
VISCSSCCLFRDEGAIAVLAHSHIPHVSEAIVMGPASSPTLMLMQVRFDVFK